MAHPSVINAQLSRLGVRPSRWFRAELRELEHILHNDEEIAAFATGRYFGGLAILVATDHRLILVDKKPMFLSVEDIRYDMISEINYSARLINSHITVFTINKQHSFISSYRNRIQLRHLTYFVQQRILSLHQNSSFQINAYDQQPSYQQSQQREPNQQPEQHQQATQYQQSQQQAQNQQYPRQNRVLRTPRYRSTQHVSQTIGAIANKATSTTPNPFAKNQLLMRRRWSRF